MKNYTKLLEAKKEIGKATKNATNPHFKNKYVDINALIDTVEPILLSKGLILLQPIEDGKQYTRIIDAEDGSFIESYLTLPLGLTAQATGSCLTYFRRYTLQNLLSMQSQDDDGQQASAEKPKQLINEKQFNKICERLENGEVEIIGKLKESFVLTAQQELEINEILNK
jgi:hypothetical protein